MIENAINHFENVLGFSSQDKLLDHMPIAALQCLVAGELFARAQPAERPALLCEAHQMMPQRFAAEFHAHFGVVDGFLHANAGLRDGPLAMPTLGATRFRVLNAKVAQRRSAHSRFEHFAFGFNAAGDGFERHEFEQTKTFLCIKFVVFRSLRI